MSNALICDTVSFFAGVMQIFIDLLYFVPSLSGLTPPSVQSVVGSVFGCDT